MLYLGILCGILCIIGFFTDPDQFFHSYLTAYAYWWTLSMGGLFFTMLHYLTNATWSIVLRRIAETVMSTIPFMALLFIPLFFGFDNLYEWSVPEIVEHDHLLSQKTGYLNDTFFTIRSIFYFSIWILLSRKLYSKSIKQYLLNTFPL